MWSIKLTETPGILMVGFFSRNYLMFFRARSKSVPSLGFSDFNSAYVKPPLKLSESELSITTFLIGRNFLSSGFMAGNFMFDMLYLSRFYLKISRSFLKLFAVLTECGKKSKVIISFSTMPGIFYSYCSGTTIMGSLLIILLALLKRFDFFRSKRGLELSSGSKSNSIPSL